MKRTPLNRKSPLRRSSMKRQVDKRRQSSLEFPDGVKSWVRSRAGFRCEVQAPGCQGPIQHYHHRLLRSHGGAGTLENCLGACGRCHTNIHSHVDWAYRHGLLIRAFTTEPAESWTAGCGFDCEINHAGQ